MSTDTHAAPSYRKYFMIWVALIVLLAVSTFVSYLPVSHKKIILMILFVSLVKMGLVTLFYMHLKFEKLPIWVVALFPFFLLGLAGLLVFLGLALIPG